MHPLRDAVLRDAFRSAEDRLVLAPVPSWVERGQVVAQVVTYRVNDSTTVKFEVDLAEGFRSAGPEEVLGKVQQAVGPAVEAAKAVLDKVKEARPDGVELKFGIKVSGGASWLVAKTAGEANFDVTLTWSRPDHQSEAKAATDQ